jgi:hypothetical protein
MIFGEREKKYIRTPVIQMQANWIANLLGPSDKFVEYSTKLTCLEITGDCIKYSTVYWLLELQMWC